MKKHILFVIVYIVSLNCLAGSEISIKLEKINEIRGEGDNYFIGKIQSFDIDENGNIYLVDSMDYSILKFNNSGKFLKKIRKKGEGPGEFRSKPYFIDYSERKIYVGLD